MGAPADVLVITSRRGLTPRQREVVLGDAHLPVGVERFPSTRPDVGYRERMTSTARLLGFVMLCLVVPAVLDRDVVLIAVLLASSVLIGGVMIWQVRRKQAQVAAGHWPNGLTLWSDRFICYGETGRVVTAPWSAVRSIETTPSGHVVLETTTRDGGSTRTIIGPFLGDPAVLDTALQARLVDGAERPTTAG